MPAVDQSIQKTIETRARTLAIIALVIVNALWGLSFPLMKSLNQQMEHGFQMEASQISWLLHVAFTSCMIGLRFFIALLLLCAFCPGLVRNATRFEWQVGVYVGLFFYFGLVLQVMGLASIPASRSGFLTSLTTVFTPILSAALFRRIPTINVAIGAFAALVGVSILTGLIVCDQWRIGVSPDALSKWTIGDTLTTIGSVLFTCQLLVLDHYGKKVNSAAITPGMFLTVVIAAAITFFSLHRIGLPKVESGSEPLLIWVSLFSSPMVAGMILFLAVFCSVIAFLGMNRYQPDITAAQASIIYSTEPVFASLWALFVPGLLTWVSFRFGYPDEQLSLPLVLGGAIILMANVVALWPRENPPDAPTET
jgi:drug/metabolite transporter (DMT)-like permease